MTWQFPIAVLPSLIRPAQVLIAPYCAVLAVLVYGRTPLALRRVVGIALLAVTCDLVNGIAIAPLLGDGKAFKAINVLAAVGLEAFAMGVLGQRSVEGLSPRAWAKVSGSTRARRARGAFAHALCFSAGLACFAIRPYQMDPVNANGVLMGMLLGVLPVSLGIASRGAPEWASSHNWMLGLAMAAVGLASSAASDDVISLQCAAVNAWVFATLGYFFARDQSALLLTMAAMAVSSAILLLDTPYTSMGVRLIWSGAIMSLLCGLAFVEPGLAPPVSAAGTGGEAVAPKLSVPRRKRRAK